MDAIYVSVLFYFKPIQFSIRINVNIFRIYIYFFTLFYIFSRTQYNLHAIKDDRSSLEFQSFQIKIVRVIFPNDSHLDIQFFQYNSILVFKTISRFFADSTTKFLASRYTIFAFEY